MRFTATRAVSGLSPEAIQSASCRRPLSPEGIDAGRPRDTAFTNPRATSSPSAWALPRIVIRMAVGFAASWTAKATGTVGAKNSACSMSRPSFPTRASSSRRSFSSASRVGAPVPDFTAALESSSLRISAILLPARSRSAFIAAICSWWSFSRAVLSDCTSRFSGSSAVVGQLQTPHSALLIDSVPWKIPAIA